MNLRPGTLVAAVCIVVVGFAIGAWLALRTRGPAEQTQRATVARSTVAAPPGRTPGLRPERTAAPAAPPTELPTAAPTAKPEPTVSVVSTAVQGSWRIDEANAQVGTIVWAGNAQATGGNTIALNVHKQSVGGRAAMPCERQTVLHAAFSLGVAQQTVPYREVNCDGIVSAGEVRVTSFSSTGASFSGSFWQNGENLGNFDARNLSR